MKKKRKKLAINGTVILLMVAAMITYYYYLSNRDKVKEENNPKLTAVQEVLLRDLERNYPQTPKEVIRYYSELTKCFYNEDYSSEELEGMAEKARNMYDEELLANNEWGEYIIQLKTEVDSYKGQKLTVSSYSVSSSTDVEYYSNDDRECARVRCTYLLKQNSVKSSVEEIFILRKDEDGHWKILGWDLARDMEDKIVESTEGVQ